MSNTIQQGSRNGQSQQQEQQQTQQQFQVKPQDIEIEGNDDSNYLSNLEAAINQLTKIVDNPSSSARMSASQSSEQFQVLLEKYQKIEQMVSLDQEQINQLVNTHLQLQSDLSNEYVSYSNIIAQGKHDIIQATIVNKQALQYQSKGQMKVLAKQKAAESLAEEVATKKKELSKNNQLIQEKAILDKSLDEQNLRFQRTIEEFKKDQAEQKGGMESCKQQILQGEKEVTLVKKEQLDMQRKVELLRKTTRDIKQKTVQFQSAKEVAAAELKNEKRMLSVSQRKYQELQQGLQSLETEIERSNEHRLQIIQVNEDLKRKVHLVQSSMLVNSYEGAEVEELRALEGLLGQYNSLVSEKSRIIGEKQSEKGVLEEHLSQLSLFAQQYVEKQELLEKQQQQLQNQNYQKQVQQQQYQLQQQQQQLQQQQHAQLSKQQQLQQQQFQQQQGQVVFLQDQVNSENAGQEEEYDLNDNNNHNIHDQQNMPHDGMERIQSQYEQEQDSLTLPNSESLPTKAVLQSNESGLGVSSFPANHPIFQEYQLQEDQKNPAENQQKLQRKEEPEHFENDLAPRQEEYQETNEVTVESKNANQTQDSPNKLESAIQTHVDNLQVHMDTPSDSEILNIEKYSPQHESNSQEELIQNQLYHKYDPTAGSFGGNPEGNSEESSVGQHNFSPFPGGTTDIQDNGLDSEQQLIANEFSQGDIQVNSTVKLSEFLKQQEEKEKRENGANQASSNPSDSSKALSHENKRILAQMSVPGIGYQKIINELRNSMHKSGLLQQQQQEQQEHLDQQKQQQLIGKSNK